MISLAISAVFVGWKKCRQGSAFVRWKFEVPIAQCVWRNQSVLAQGGAVISPWRSTPFPLSMLSNVCLCYQSYTGGNCRLSFRTASQRWDRFCHSFSLRRGRVWARSEARDRASDSDAKVNIATGPSTWLNTFRSLLSPIAKECAANMSSYCCFAPVCYHTDIMSLW